MEMKEMKINKSSYFRNTHNIYDTTSDISFNKRAKHQRQQVAKVIWHKTASPPQRMAQSYSPGGVNVSSHVDTLAPPANTIELVLPSANPSP